MNVTLITTGYDQTPPLGTRVSDALQACGLSLNHTLRRQSGDELAPLLPTPGDGLLVLTSPKAHTAMDLQALAQATRAHPQWHVVLLCDDDSKDLLMQAMRVGVREVLPLHPSQDELQRCFSRWSDTPEPTSASPARPGQMLVFMGCKGGTGTSFVAANIAWLAATEFERRCAFIDLDLQSGDASFYLSSGSHKNDLGDLTRQIERLDARLLSSCLHPVNERLNLLAAPRTPESAMTVTAPDIAQVLTLARHSHQDVVVDVPRTLNAVSLKALDMADQIAIVMHNTTPDVRDAQRMVRTLLSLGCPENRLSLIVNRYAPDGWVSLKDLEKTVGIAVSHTLPDNPQWVGEALHWGKPLAQVNDHNTLIRALRATTADVLHTPLPQRSGWISRWMGKAA